MAASRLSSTTNICLPADFPGFLPSAAGLAASGRRDWRTVGQKRDSHDELASFSGTIAERGRRAAVHFRQPPGKRQTDSQSAFGTIERLFRLREKLKHLGQHFGRNADTVVSHAKHGFAIAAFDGQPDVTAFGRIFGRVVQQIQKYLRHPRQVGVDTHRLDRGATLPISGGGHR